MIAATIAHDLTDIGTAITTLSAHCGRRYQGHTRQVLCALRVEHDRHGGTLPDDDRRTLAAYYHARREYWRDVLTTNDLAAIDDRSALDALALGAPAWHREGV